MLIKHRTKSAKNKILMLGMVYNTAVAALPAFVTGKY